MAVNLLVNGVNYTYPTLTDEGWGPDASNWALAITQGTLQKAAGLFALTQDVDFGPTGGLKSIYYKSRSANIASAGQVRLSLTDTIDFRNAANSGNNTFGSGSTDARPAWNGTDLALSGDLTPPGGSVGELQFNNSGTFGGTTGITFNGSDLLTGGHTLNMGHSGFSDGQITNVGAVTFNGIFGDTTVINPDGGSFAILANTNAIELISSAGIKFEGSPVVAMNAGSGSGGGTFYLDDGFINVDGTNIGVSGTFTAGANTITVTKGIITSIV